MNLERLLVQTSLGEGIFSKVVGAAPKRTSASPARLLPELESDLPELLFICQRRSRREFTLSSCTPISATKETFEVLDEDTAQDGPLNRSVHWRVDRRFGEPIMCSTFVASRQELQSPGLQLPKFLLPETLEAKVTIENYISNKWKRIRRKNLDVPSDDAIPDSPLILISRKRTGGFTAIPSMAMEPEQDFIVLDQDMDFENSPSGRPVHWRIEQRGDQEVYCSKMIMTAEEIRNIYGVAADAIIKSRSEMTVTIETYLSDAWQEIRRPVGEPRDDVPMPNDETRRRLEEIAKRRGKPQL